MEELGSNAQEKGVKVYQNTYTCFFIGIITGPAVSRHARFAQFHANYPGLWLGAASSAGTRRQGGRDYFICTSLDCLLKYSLVKCRHKNTLKQSYHPLSYNPFQGGCLFTHLFFFFFTHLYVFCTHKMNKHEQNHSLQL